MLLKQFDGQNLEELSMIEVAYAVLESREDVVPFHDLLILVQGYLQMSDAQLEASMTRFYTDLNIDGRFISVGDNRWGLRTWYPVDSIDEETVTSADEDEDVRRRRKKRKVNVFADEDLIDYNDDDPEDDDAYDDDDYAIDYDEEEDEDDDALGNLRIRDEENVEEELLDEDEVATKELEQYQADLSGIGETDVEDVDLSEEDDEASSDDESEDDF